MASLSSVSLCEGQKGRSGFTRFYFSTSLGAWGMGLPHVPSSGLI